MKEISKDVPLPADFRKFITRNYEIIEEIKQKIKQFEEPKEVLKRNRGRFHDGYCSFDSGPSDDTADIIYATVIPKVKLVKNYDTFEYDSDDLQAWEEETFNPHEEEISQLMQKFPLVYLSAQEKTPEPCASSNSSTKGNFNGFICIKGVQLKCADRQGKSSQANITKTYEFLKQKKRCYSYTNKRRTRQDRVSPRHFNTSKKNKQAREEGPKKEITLSSATIDDLTLELYKRYYSNNSQLQLTLPPLHSSVLTLLGQRPPTKPSPRNATGQEATTSPILSSRKKLRRHGRKTKGKEATDTDRNKREGSQQSAVQGETRRKDVVDDPHDTQMSRMSQNDDDEDVQKGNGGVVMESLAELNAKRFQTYLDQTARSLHEVLDEQLIGTEWNSNEMQFIDENIEALKSDFRKYETKFKAGNIRMKEDLWLSLPRTWSRSSATFGIPTDTRTLAKLTPLEYIRRYIFISEHRKLLYSLVFHRYRTMENPTGKTITYKTVQRALTEVLGRNLRPDEATKLQCSFLDVPNSDVDITEDLFRSICAVSERVFGKYSLEDCNECYSCLKYTGKDKNRCHKNQKDQTEKVDFQYVAARIKDGRVNPALAELLQTVFDRG